MTTTAKQTHTPTPWTADNSGMIDCIYATGPYGDALRLAEMIGPQSEANAAHIVRCVNERDELVAALAGVLLDLEITCTTPRHGAPRLMTSEEFEAFPKVQAARAALAKAGEA